MKRALSEATKVIASAISSAVPMRLRGMVAESAAFFSGAPVRTAMDR
jgi:hypothetical protein